MLFQSSSPGPARSRVAWPRRCLAGAGMLLAAPSAPAGFTDVTAGTGIAHVHAVADEVPLSGTLRAGRITRTVASNHAGAAAVDVNADGRTDLLFARWGQAPVLYVNLGDGNFRDETASRGLAAAVDAAAFAAGDLDNDGDDDLFAVPHRGPRFFLLLNDGSGRFSEVAVERGAAVPTTVEDHEGYSVGLVDYDRDGYLDVYVSEWGVLSGEEDPLHSVLLRNRGAEAPGHFRNVTAAAGLTQPGPGRSEHYGFSSAWADLDADGWPDLAIAGDFGASRLYWNNGDGTFREGTATAGLGRDEFGMGIAVADYDGDGRLDVYVTSIFEPFFLVPAGTHHGSKLYRNLGGRQFAEVSAATGTADTGWGWGAAFLEYDNDGDPDLLVTNGMDAATLGPSGPFQAALTDPTTVLRNDGGSFRDVTTVAGVTDRGLGKAVVVVDYDNDGDEDAIITQTFAAPVVYRNNATTNGQRWIRFRFRGTTSNRSGIGAVVRVTAGGRTQTALFNPTNSYLGPREPVLHFGLGPAGAAVESVTVQWPSGIVQSAGALATNQVHALTEPPAPRQAPSLSMYPQGGDFVKDSEVVLGAAATGEPAPVYLWEKDGVPIPGATGPSLRFGRLHPADAGVYRVTAINPLGRAASAGAVVRVVLGPAPRSVARRWNEALLDAIRLDRPDPAVHARNLYHLSAAMWDAYWAYHDDGWSRAQPVFHREEPPAATPAARGDAQAQAISFAAYRVLSERFRRSPAHARAQPAFRWLMEQLGCDPADESIHGSTAAAVGNRIGLAVLAATREDGANEVGGYADVTGYAPTNAPLIVALPGTVMAEPSRWQPLALRHSVSQNGLVTGEAVQTFVGANALRTTPFALLKRSPTELWHDPGPPPRLDGPTAKLFVEQAVEVIALSSMLDPADGVTLDISPGVSLNHPLGTNDGVGHARNPETGQPYAANVVLRGDYARVLAEYWADGPASETPPGHWNVIHNELTDHPSFRRHYSGQGRELSLLEWDVRAYLALNGALHDAACAAWTLKHVHDSARPISMIRHLAQLGQSTDPGLPSFHRDGLPLVPGSIELISAATTVPGARHEALAAHVGKLAIRAWRGNPPDPANDRGGVGWILAEEWVPYQRDTFVSPAFPGFVSGHSTFSRAAAEVLTLLTGSPFFPGGLAERRFAADRFLGFERGPTRDVVLQWATYYDAADQAGRSRLWGGIHVSADDLSGRVLGSAVGFDAFLRAEALHGGGAARRPLRNVSTRGRTGPGDEVLITGFVIDGESNAPPLLRVIGPGLRAFGVEHVDEDPQLELHAAGAAQPLLVNDDWAEDRRAGDTRRRAAEVGAFALSESSRDAACVVDPAAGGFTMLARSATPAKRGVVLTEVYADRLVNLSARGMVAGGEADLIAGFVLEGEGLTAVLVRGVGPALSAFGVAGPLADPRVSVHRLHPDRTVELIARNDDWEADAGASLTRQAARRANAFALEAGSRDAALFLQLPAGAYTVAVSGAGAVPGVALVEVYHIK